MSWTRKLRGTAETHRLAARLGALVQPDDVIGLIGDLGAGKTLFVQGLAAGLDVAPQTRVTSPTFTLLNEYRGGRLTLYHADLYRIEADREVDEIGLIEAMESGGVSAVEWCNRFDVLPDDHLRVELEVAGDEERIIRVRGTGPGSSARAAAWEGAI